ncbi:hypothetical protein CAEBREN_23527 [Caenorhabditis brenneri]|uniref:C-type lectin domain-containing protein n=1 Tax=Caenorhabditis brenneri TaxID=135651 RepID=G0N3Z2_CAEBE|nr:hypothetical protein CAEBREN_23527 [Caenorhabditis brenneri]
MRIKIFIAFTFLILTTVAQDFDWSFKKMCAFWGGKDTFKPREGGSKAMAGDKCSFTFPMATDTELSARTYCETYVPYHIISVVPGPNTVCNAEATLICASGWVQMFGRCYKMTKELMTHEQAEEHCAKQEQKSTIAFMHREALPFRIYDYFTGVYSLWLEASIAITQDLIYDVAGGHLLLAIDGYPYNLPNVALARVAPTEKAMVLCEYTPRMNQAESNYLLKRYGEIYYPTIFTSDSAYVRTASVLQRNDKDPSMDHEYCKHVLRPFLQTDDAQAAVPTREFLDALKKERVAEIIRTSVYSGDSKVASRSNPACSVSDSRNYGMEFPGDGKNFFKTMKDEPIWSEDQPKEVCDGASWSTGIVLSRSSPAGLEVMSDARAAPIYCQTTFDVMEYGDCPENYKPFYRKETGQKFCHDFIDKPRSYDEAEADCAGDGAHISGFTGQEELDFLDSLLDAAQEEDDVPFGHENSIWLGAKRREACNRKGIQGKEGGFNPEPTHPCSRLRVFEWVHGVAQNPPDFENRWIGPLEPNFVSDDEKCVELLKGEQTVWDDKNGDKKLNDIPCNDRRLYYFCGKEAPIVSKKNIL